MAVIAANLLAYYVSSQVLNIPYRFNPGIGLLALFGAAVAVPLAAWLGLRSFLNVPPRTLLQSV